MVFKTDWKYDDEFDLTVDYGRIKGNIEAIKSLAKTLYTKVITPKLKDYSYSDIPYADFFNSIEQSLQRIASSTFQRQNMEAGKAYIQNGAIFTYEDLNRIEKGLRIVYADLLSAKKNRQCMAITLGGVVAGGVSFG